MKSNRAKRKKPSSPIRSPNRLRISASDLGPCTASGQTSGSSTLTSSAMPTARPLAHSSMSASATENQKWSSARQRITGSLSIPP